MDLTLPTYELRITLCHHNCSIVSIHLINMSVRVGLDGVWSDNVRAIVV